MRKLNLKQTIRNGLAGSALALGLCAIALPGSTDPMAPAAIYVSNAQDDTVTVIGSSVKTIAVGDNPQGIAVTRDGTRVYTANATSNTISVINTATLQVIETIPLPAGSMPYSVAVSPDGSKLYVAEYGENRVRVLDTTDKSVLASLLTPQALHVALSPDGSRLITTNFQNSYFTFYDTSDDSALDQIGSTLTAYSASFDRTGTRAYLTSTTGEALVVDMTQLQVINSLSIGTTPHASIPSADGTRLYSVNWGSKVRVTDIATDTAVADIVVGGTNTHSIAMSADGSQVYVGNYGTHGSSTPGTLSVIDTASNTLVSEITVGANPSSIAVHGNPALPTNILPAGIPTLSEWAMILMGLALAGAAALTLQMRRQNG